MSNNLVALLRECRKIIIQSYFGGNPHSDLLSRIDAALTEQPPKRPEFFCDSDVLNYPIRGSVKPDAVMAPVDRELSGWARTWRSHDNTGMRFLEESDLSGGETDTAQPSSVMVPVDELARIKRNAERYEVVREHGNKFLLKSCSPSETGRSHYLPVTIALDVYVDRMLAAAKEPKK